MEYAIIINWDKKGNTSPPIGPYITQAAAQRDATRMRKALKRAGGQTPVRRASNGDGNARSCVVVASVVHTSRTLEDQASGADNGSRKQTKTKDRENDTANQHHN
jgi:hypothetical protein